MLKKYKLWDLAVETPCHSCNYVGDLKIFSKKIENSSKTHYLGVCPKCDTTIISYSK